MVRHGARLAGLYATCALLWLWCAPVSGQTTATWASASDGSWTAAGAWSISPAYPNDGQPNPGDTYIAVIDAAGASYTVLLANTIGLTGLVLNSGSATLQHSAGTLTLAGAGSINAGTYLMTGGTIGGAGTFEIASRLNWDTGTMSGAGLTRVLPGAVLNIGPGGTTRNLARTLESAGTTNVSGALGFSGGTFANLAGGVVNVSIPGNFFGNVIFQNTITNAGTININPGIGGIATMGPRLFNSGTIICSSGTLQFGNQVTHDPGSYIGGTAYIDFGSQQTLSGGTTTYAGPNMHMHANLTGPGNLVFASTFEWINGTLGGTGTASILPGVTVNSGTNGNRRELDRLLSNSGTFNILSGQLAIAYLAAGTFNNLSTGVINMTGGGSFGNGAWIGGGFLNGLLSNDGTINVNGGAGVATISTRTSNSATISVNSGTLVIQPDNSTFSHNGGSVIRGPGTLTLAGTSARHTIGPGTATWSVATTNFNSGTIDGAGTLRLDGVVNWTGGSANRTGAIVVNGTLNWNSGSIGSQLVPNPAPFTIGATGVLNMSTFAASRSLTGTLSSTGVINFTSGTLGLRGGTLHNATGGVLNLGSSFAFPQIASSNNRVINDGTLNTLGGAGSLVIAVPLVNNGVINVSSGSLSLFNSSITSGGTINGAANNILMLTLTGGQTGPIDGGGSLIVNTAGGSAQCDRVRQSAITLQPDSHLRIRAGGTTLSTSRGTTLTFSAGSTLDLADNDLVIDYDAASPLADVAQWIAAGQLTSSSADALHALGYADNSVLNLPNFSGQTIDPTTLLVKYTYVGDANLDGQVDISDLASLATAWQSGGSWVNGDFDRSGFIDISDLALLATNWQAGVGSPLPQPLGAALASVGLAGAQAPEPGPLPLTLLLSLLITRHRR